MSARSLGSTQGTHCVPEPGTPPRNPRNGGAIIPTADEVTTPIRAYETRAPASSAGSHAPSQSAQTLAMKLAPRSPLAARAPSSPTGSSPWAP